MAIIISQNGKNAQRLEESSFGLEDKLQQYIADNPDVIPLYEIDENIRLLILAREFPTSSGPIDAVGVDQFGNIYLIETKLFKNPDKRRVVAQVLDYGAALWRSSVDSFEFLEQLSAASQQLFGKTMKEKASEFFGIDEQATDELLDGVRQNLGSASFKFVVLMDKLEKRLKDLIIFLNQNSQFDVFAVELEYYKKEQFEIIIPKIHGAEVKKEVRSVRDNGTRQYRKWDDASFIQQASDTVNQPQFAQLMKIYNWCKENTDSVEYGDGQVGSLKLKIKRFSSYAFVLVFADGRIRLQFWEFDPNAKRTLLDILHKHIANLELLTQIDQLAEKENSFKNIAIDTIGPDVDNLLKALSEFSEQ